MTFKIYTRLYTNLIVKHFVANRFMGKSFIPSFNYYWNLFFFKNKHTSLLMAFFQLFLAIRFQVKVGEHHKEYGSLRDWHQSVNHRVSDMIHINQYPIKTNDSKLNQLNLCDILFPP